SPLFQSLEQALSSQDITNEVAERSITQYLDGLDTIGFLDFRAITHEETDGAYRILHIVARTRSAPHDYYYTQRTAFGIWTSWEKIDVGIESEHLMAVVHRGRLHLIWPTLRYEADDARAVRDALAPNEAPPNRVTVELSWTVRSRLDGWQPARKGRQQITVDHDDYTWRWRFPRLPGSTDQRRVEHHIDTDDFVFRATSAADDLNVEWWLWGQSTHNSDPSDER